MEILYIQIALCIMIFAQTVDSAAYVDPEPCPDPYKPGDKWRPRMDHCFQCDCEEHRRYCYSCGAFYPLTPSGTCYIEHKPGYLPYPECCEMITICHGDAAFNVTKLNVLKAEWAGFGK